MPTLQLPTALEGNPGTAEGNGTGLIRFRSSTNGGISANTAGRCRRAAIAPGHERVLSLAITLLYYALIKLCHWLSSATERL